MMIKTNVDTNGSELVISGRGERIVGVEEDMKNGFSINPNPSDDYIEIYLNNVILSEVKNPVIVYDLLGIIWMDSRLRGNDILVSSEGNIRIDVSSLSPGVYFVSVGGRMYKFVKM